MLVVIRDWMIVLDTRAKVCWIACRTPRSSSVKPDERSLAQITKMPAVDISMNVVGWENSVERAM